MLFQENEQCSYTSKDSSFKVNILHMKVYITIRDPQFLYIILYNNSCMPRITKDLEKDRVTDEGWNSQKKLSGPVEKKKKEKTPVSSSKTFTRFSSYRFLIYYRVGIAWCIRLFAYHVMWVGRAQI